MPTCRLCQSTDVAHFHQDKHRGYLRCQQCLLVFVDEASLLPLAQEKAIYDQHQNHPEDLGYRRFLNRLASPLLQRLGDAPQKGLDFGCGPGPTLSLMLEHAGHTVALYDPIYYPHTHALKQQYDFITCTEAIEHFHYPHKEWQQLLALLKPGGWLGIMTKLVIDQAAFQNWHYKNDRTHVSFFSSETFAYLAQKYGLQWEILGGDVIIMRTPR